MILKSNYKMQVFFRVFFITAPGNIGRNLCCIWKFLSRKHFQYSCAKKMEFIMRRFRGGDQTEIRILLIWDTGIQEAVN